ncbi:MAG: glycosyltransferase family 2 protein [Actinomycetota bacterium]|nr:glycosyltransferase family 2 protein [Actinomycetota bacterium]
MTIPASVAIIAYNEEKRIRACLESLKDFSEIVIVLDTRTNDATEAIAREFGCEIFRERWKGFGPQKQNAVEKCSNEWVLIIDCDEVLPAETAHAISSAIINPISPSVGAYSFPRKNYLHGRWMRHGDFWPDRQTRLVRRGHGKFNSIVHESWAPDAGRITALDCPIEHRPFENYADMLETLNNYSTLIAEDLFARGKRTGAIAPFSHASWMFFRTYFVKMGLLDGFDGFVSAALKAGGSFFKYAKLLELQRSH